MARQFLDKGGLDAFWELMKAAINELLLRLSSLSLEVRGKADTNHTHSSISTSESSARVEVDSSNVKIYDNAGVLVLKARNTETRESGIELLNGKSGNSVLSIDDDELRLMFPNDKTNYGISIKDDGMEKTLTIKAPIHGEIEFDAYDKLLLADSNIHIRAREGVKIDAPTEFNMKSDSVKLQTNTRVSGYSSSTILKGDKSMTVLAYQGTECVRLKPTSTELKFQGKGITLDDNETKITADLDIWLTAPEIRLGDASDPCVVYLNGLNLSVVQAHTDVELLIEDQGLHIVAPKGLIKATDDVTFARYISTHPDNVGAEDRRGWVVPKYNSPSAGIKNEEAVMFRLVDVTTNRPYIQSTNREQFELVFNENSHIGGDARIWGDTIAIAFSRASLYTRFRNLAELEMGMKFFETSINSRLRLANKKLGVRISRNGQNVTGWLPFTVRAKLNKNATKVSGLCDHVGLSRWTGGR